MWSILNKIEELKREAESLKNKAKTSDNSSLFLIVSKYYEVIAAYSRVLEEETTELIDFLFAILERADYEYIPAFHDIETYFWHKFYDYFKKLQKTEQNRIINQLSDIERGE